MNWSADNISGSLAISYGPGTGGELGPFHVYIDKTDPVHIFDTCNLAIILRELDTVHDFTSYLDEKAKAIRQFHYLTYCGEEDLLAHYFLNFDKRKGRHFIGVRETNIDGIMIGEGGMAGVRSNRCI